MTKDISWGVLSTSDFAINQILPAIERCPNAKFTAIACRNKEKGLVVANKYNADLVEGGYQDLLSRDDIDVVYIPLPNSLHAEWAIKALNSGKHVLVEKPAGCSLAEIKEMVELSRRMNLAIMENFHYKFHSQHEFVKNHLKNDNLGKIRSIHSSFAVPDPFEADNIRYNNEIGGGALLDVGVYVVNVCDFLFDDNFELKSVVSRMNNKLSIDWYGGILLEQKQNGIIAQLSYGFDNYYQNRYEIIGSEGKLTVGRAFTPKPDFKPIITLGLNGKKEEVIELDKDDQYLKSISYMCKLCEMQNKEQTRQDILRQAEMINRIQNSVRVNAD